MLKKLALWALPLCIVAMNSGCYLLDGGYGCPGYGGPCGYAGNCADNAVGDCVDDCAYGPRCDDYCPSPCRQKGPLDLVLGLLNCNSYGDCGCGERYCGDCRGEPWGCGPCDGDGNYVGGGPSYGPAPYQGGVVHEDEVLYEGHARPSATRTARAPNMPTPARTTRAPAQHPTTRTIYGSPNPTARAVRPAPQPTARTHYPAPNPTARASYVAPSTTANRMPRPVHEATAARYVGAPKIISQTDEVVKPTRVEPDVPVTATAVEVIEPAPATGKWTAARSRTIAN